MLTAIALVPFILLAVHLRNEKRIRKSYQGNYVHFSELLTPGGVLVLISALKCHGQVNHRFRSWNHSHCSLLFSRKLIDCKVACSFLALYSELLALSQDVMLKYHRIRDKNDQMPGKILIQGEI